MAPVKKRSAEAPMGVKVISVLFFILSFMSIIGGILMMWTGSAYSQYAAGMILGSMSIIFIIFGIVGIICSVGLWKRKNWERIVTVVVFALVLLSGLVSLFSGAWRGVIDAIIGGVVVWYLFTPKVKAAF